jgi:riboflavin biosynthesis pyrimidine reductase
MSTELPIEPLDRLFEAEGLAAAELPAPLEALYGGTFGLDEPLVYTNFVSALDGVVAVPSVPRSNALIAANSDGDRFVMGLLRSFADCVLIGAGTLRASPKGTWLAERVFPDAADAFADLRKSRGQPAKPEIAIISGRGSIDPAHPALASGALVVTSDEGAERLQGLLPREAGLLALGSKPQLDVPLVVQALRERGHRLILSEAGPHTFGELLAAEVVDELFLTLSPLLAGGRGDDTTYGLVESAELFPPGVPARLLSVRRQGQHLFLRYALGDPRAKEPR